MKIKNCIKLIFAIITFGVSIVSIQEYLITKTKEIGLQKTEITDGKFQNEFFSDQQRKKMELYSEECKTILRNVEKDVSYFPVAESSVDKALKTSFVDSWMSERTFGGKRGHEGTDIMVSKNERDLYPVVSMSSGTVTNLGWIEKGGYRVGITSDSGIYYYYAHLSSYSNIEEGMRIKAGDLLGFMGDTGYGKEGTKGKFPVHLHVGVYIYDKGQEISLNPYNILCYLENKKLKYAYF